MRQKPPGKTPTAAAPELTEDTPEILDRFHLSLRDLLEKGDLHEHDYFKGIISLAVRWISIGREEDAVRLVGELTPEYVKHGMPLQMATDETFRVVAHTVAQTLDGYSPDMDDDDVKLALMMLERPKAQA